MSEKLGWTFKWMFLMCSRRSSARHCFESLSDHKTIHIQIQVVSVSVAQWASAAAQHYYLSLLSMLGFAQSEGNKQCPRRRTWDETSGSSTGYKPFLHFVNVTGVIHGQCSTWMAAQLFIMVSLTLAISIRIKWVVFGSSYSLCLESFAQLSSPPARFQTASQSGSKRV